MMAHLPDPRDHATWALPVDAWPPNDQSAWEAARRRGAFLEPSGRAAAWAPATRQLTEKTYGQYLGRLEQIGQLDPAATVADRLTLPLVTAFVDHLLQVNVAQTVLARLTGLRLFASACDPGLKVDFLPRLMRELRPQVVDSLDKAQRLRHTAELVALGLDLIAGSHTEGGASPSRRLAVRYRDGFMIALLALRPLRLKNFTALTLDRHLVRRGGVWWIVVEAQETKTRTPIEQRFPKRLAGILETYLREIRPVLRSNRPAWHDDGRLWLSERGHAMPAGTIYTRLTRRTAKAFGRSVNPHLFRDALATTLALEDPEHVRAAAQVLGHSTFATTERFYRMSRMAEAVRAHDDLLEALLRQPASKRRKR